MAFGTEMGCVLERHSVTIGEEDAECTTASDDHEYCRNLDDQTLLEKYLRPETRLSGLMLSHSPNSDNNFGF